MNKTDLAPEELETVKMSRLPTTVITEASVCMKNLGMFVTVQFVEDTSSGTVSGKFLEEMSIHTRGKNVKQQILLRIASHFVPRSLRSFAFAFAQ